jgi:hypothetical protein
MNSSSVVNGTTSIEHVSCLLGVVLGTMKSDDCAWLIHQFAPGSLADQSMHELPCSHFTTVKSIYAQDVGLFLAGSGSREQPTAAHVLQCVRDRGWPVLAADPHPLRALDSTVEVDELP